VACITATNGALRNACLHHSVAEPNVPSQTQNTFRCRVIGDPTGLRPVRAERRQRRLEVPFLAPPHLDFDDQLNGHGAHAIYDRDNISRRNTKPPSQTWRTFLANHLQQLAAADFFVVPTATCRLLFVLIILAHERWRVVHVAVTDHPTAAWTAQQLREAVSLERRTSLSDPRSRFGVPCLDHDRRGARHRGSPHRASLAMAERVRRAAD